MAFKNQHPNDIISRSLVLEEIRTIPASLILQLPVEFHKFVKGSESSIFDAKGTKNSSAKIDWEYALFEATLQRLYDLLNYFNKVQTDEKTPEPILKR